VRLALHEEVKLGLRKQERGYNGLTTLAVLFTSDLELARTAFGPNARSTKARCVTFPGRSCVVPSTAQSRPWYQEERIAAAGIWHEGGVKEPMMGRCTQIIGQGCLYARVIEFSDAFMIVK
jgi:hypothetical protein